MWLDCPEPALQAVWAMCLIEAVHFFDFWVERVEVVSRGKE